MSLNSKTCFIIMPIGSTSEIHTEEFWKNHFENFLKPVIENDFKDLTVKRSEALRGDILNQIIHDLVESSIVIADITEFNPNVMWELGIRQSFKHGTITIAEEGTKERLPFDFAHKGTLFYNLSHHPYSREHKKFLTNLRKAIQDCLSNPTRPDSHVLENIHRGELYEIIKREENMRKLDAIIEEFNMNIETLKHSLETSKKNQKERKKKSKKPPKIEYVTVRCRHSAIESLIVNRYLNQDEKFYKDYGYYFRYLLAVNYQLGSWKYTEKSTEPWLIETIPMLLERIEIIKQNIESNKNKLMEMR